MSHYKDHMQENESMFLNDNLKETIDPFKLKIKNLSTERTKTLTTSEEPSHYSEFATKLDYIVEKVTDLAKSSGDVSVDFSEGKDFQNAIRNKSLNAVKTTKFSHQKHPDSGSVINEKVVETLDSNKKQNKPVSTNEEYSNILYFGHLNCSPKELVKTSICSDKDSVLELDPQHSEYRVANTHDSSTVVVPPILNDNIKYIRVNSKDFITNVFNLDSLSKGQESILFEKQASIRESKRQFEKNTYKFNTPLSFNTMSKRVNLNSCIQAINSVNEVKKETFKILISGHLTKGETPMFIIHKNYVGSSVLIRDSLDFRTHKKEGNVDIFLTGKFFHDNILIENEKGYPSALDLKSHMLIIDSKSPVTQERFKYTFHLGLFDVVIEGEFVENSETLQYIPIFSLEIFKHKPRVEIDFNKSLTTIKTNEEHLKKTLRCETKDCIMGKQESIEKFLGSQEHEHLQYSTTQDNSLGDTSKRIKSKDTKENPKESRLEKLKNSNLFKLFFKKKGNNSNDFQNAKPFQNTRGNRNIKKKGKDEQVILMMNEIKDDSLKQNKETRREKDAKLEQKIVLEISEVNSNINNIESDSSTKSVPIDKRNGSKGQVMNRKYVKKKRNRRSTIVENPGVTQMQGFFFQT